MSGASNATFADAKTLPLAPGALTASDVKPTVDTEALASHEPVADFGQDTLEQNSFGLAGCQAVTPQAVVSPQARSIMALQTSQVDAEVVSLSGRSPDFVVSPQSRPTVAEQIPVGSDKVVVPSRSGADTFANSTLPVADPAADMPVEQIRRVARTLKFF